MNEMKEHRIRASRGSLVASIYKSYLEEHPELYQQHIPSPTDLCMFPEVKKILDYPLDVELRPRDFDAVVRHLPRYIKDWERFLEAELAGLAWEKATSHDPDYYQNPTEFEKVNLLKLATSAFVCRECKELYPQDALNVLYYPWVMSHRCLTRGEPRPPTEVEKYYTNGALDLGSSMLYHPRTPWNLNKLECVAVVHRRAICCVVSACGLDPGAATPSDLDQLDPRLFCSNCALQGQVFYPWRAAVSSFQSRLPHY